MKWSVITLALMVAGLVSACGNNTCQPGYYNTNCQYPAGYYPGGYYPSTTYPNGYYGNGAAYPSTAYGNPYYRPY